MEKGYEIRGKEEATICSDCASELSMTDMLESDSDAVELTGKRYGGEVCVACEKNIIGGAGGKIDYPREIATLLDKRFKDIGGRFGGVIPQIRSEYEEKEIRNGVKKTEAIRTQYDPVMVSLQSYEGDIHRELINFLNKLSRLGRIRYKSDEMENEDGEVEIYEVVVFAVQS